MPWNKSRTVVYVVWVETESGEKSEKNAPQRSGRIRLLTHACHTEEEARNQLATKVVVKSPHETSEVLIV